ncbi:MAG: histidinol dehydrogenase [Nitrospirae bacterium]|nr:histidinol dehydrogenase [Nitrospirota bacterium]
MKVITSDREIKSFIGTLQSRALGVSPAIAKTVRAILHEVRKKGDRAVVDFTRKFDGYTPRSLRIPLEDIKRYARLADKDFLRALDASIKRIREFHRRQVETSWSFKEDGIELGQIIRPIERVGVYVPGGKASYPSTVLMNVIPAQVAGVPEIVLCLPTPNGEVNPYVMSAINMLGIKEVYSIGGAQAIGALAYGTKSIKKVDKVVGPGNIYVATAKRLVFGEVDIDMIAGPSEILIIADSSANPAFVAGDLLSQAEHDELASSILITDSETLAQKVTGELKKQIKTLSRKAIASCSIKRYGAIIVIKDIKEAVEISNSIAVEHLEIMTQNPRRLLPLIKNAGAIFIGQWSPEPMGDYSAGPNHTLPTGGTSRFFSPLGVYDFIKRSSLIEFSKQGFMRLSKTVETLADAEGLQAHANSIRVRKFS